MSSRPEGADGYLEEGSPLLRWRPGPDLCFGSQRKKKKLGLRGCREQLGKPWEGKYQCKCHGKMAIQRSPNPLGRLSLNTAAVVGPSFFRNDLDFDPSQLGWPAKGTVA
jgi:hypothetical protein